MKRKTHGKLNLQKDKRAEMLSTGATSGSAEPMCWCGDRSLSAVIHKWLQCGDSRRMLVKVNIKLSIIVIA